MEKTLRSIYESIPDNIDYTVSIVKEHSTREDTLNYIFELEDENDVLVVADDIVFIDSWWEDLKSNYAKGGIFGFTTLNPGSNIIQDYGYDFVTIDGELSYEAFLKNISFENSGIRCSRKCSSVCGCVMYIKRDVISDVGAVPPEGNNRIGEMIYSKLARDKGHSTLVLASRVYHESISTKNTGDPKKSSLSWLYERDNWKYVSTEFFSDVEIRKAYRQHIHDPLRDLVSGSGRVIFYGCGTVADYLIGSLDIRLKNYKVVSGLKEEIGKRFRGSKIEAVTDIDIVDSDIILITSIGYEALIFDTYFNNKSLDNIFCIVKEVKSEDIIYSYAECKE